MNTKNEYCMIKRTFRYAYRNAYAMKVSVSASFNYQECIYILMNKSGKVRETSQ